MNNLEIPQNVELDSRYKLPYGLYTMELPVSNIPRMVIASGPNFRDMMNSLYSSSLSPEEEYLVVTPELITAAGDLNFTVNRDLVGPMQFEFQNFSAEHPNATFLLGTPYWTEHVNEPRNAVVVIRNGEVIQIFAKTYGTPGEHNHFDLALPSTVNNLVNIPAVGVLICRDLAIDGAGLEFKREELAGRLQLEDNRMLMNEETRIAIIASCWGVGSRITWEMLGNLKAVQSGKKAVAEHANKMFSSAMIMSASHLFEAYPKLEAIVVSDRCPQQAPSGPSDTITSSTPFNGVILRTDL